MFSPEEKHCRNLIFSVIINIPQGQNPFSGEIKNRNHTGYSSGMQSSHLIYSKKGSALRSHSGKVFFSGLKCILSHLLKLFHII